MSMKNHGPIEMVGECTDKYEAKECEDGSLDIHIKVPKRFRNLWLIRLTDMTTTMEEIKEYEEE